MHIFLDWTLLGNRGFRSPILFLLVINSFIHTTMAMCADAPMHLPTACRVCGLPRRGVGIRPHADRLGHPRAAAAEPFKFPLAATGATVDLDYAHTRRSESKPPPPPPHPPMRSPVIEISRPPGGMGTLASPTRIWC